MQILTKRLSLYPSVLLSIRWRCCTRHRASWRSGSRPRGRRRCSSRTPQPQWPPLCRQSRPPGSQLSRHRLDGVRIIFYVLLTIQWMYNICIVCTCSWSQHDSITCPARCGLGQVLLLKLSKRFKIILFCLFIRFLLKTNIFFGIVNAIWTSAIRKIVYVVKATWMQKLYLQSFTYIRTSPATRF